jgi:hypothetical protein
MPSGTVQWQGRYTWPRGAGMFSVVAAVFIDIAGTKTPRENGPKMRENRIFARLNLHTQTRDRANRISSSDGTRNPITHQRNRCRDLLRRPNIVYVSTVAMVGTPQRLCIKSMGFAQNFLQYPEYMSCVLPFLVGAVVIVAPVALCFPGAPNLRRHL